MLFQQGTTPRANLGWTPPASTRRWALSTLDQPFVHSVIAGGLGAVLGLAVLVIAGLPSQWMILFSAALISPFLVMIVRDVRRPLLALIVLDIVLKLDTNFLFNEKIAAQGAITGFNVSLTSLCLLVLYGLWIGGLLSKQIALPKGLWRMALPLAVYLGFVSLSVLWASNVLLALFEINLLLQMFLLFVYLVGTVRTREDVVLLVGMLMVGVILLSLSLIWVYVTGHNFNIAGISSGAGTDKSYTRGLHTRPGGTIGSPIDAAAFLELLLASAISIFLTRLKKFYSVLAAIAFCLGGIGLVVTLSRGGWIAFFLSSAILCFFAWRRGLLSVAIPVLMVVVVALFAFVFQDALIGRLTTDDGGSARARIILTELAFQILRDHPLRGIGANNFTVVVKQYLTPTFNGEWLYAIHNKYLLTWVEDGLGAMLALLWFLLATIRRGWITWRRKDALLAPLALGLVAGIIGQMTHMAVDVYHSRPQVESLWLVAGVVTAMYHNFQASQPSL